jgi:hypothetical protein
MRNKIESRYGITLSDDPNNWIKPTYSSTSGYINSVNIDDQISVQGYSFSLSMGFKSCKFNITYTDYVKYDDEEKKEGATIPVLSPKDKNIAPPSEKKEVPTKEHPTAANEEPATEAAVSTQPATTTAAIATTTKAATTAELVTEPVTSSVEASEASTEQPIE